MYASIRKLNASQKYKKINPPQVIKKNCFIILYEEVKDKL